VGVVRPPSRDCARYELAANVFGRESLAYVKDLEAARDYLECWIAEELEKPDNKRKYL
jgi:hypothetical protein